jgi:hypothetical protein
MMSNNPKEIFLQWKLHDVKGLITLNPVTSKTQMNTQQQAAQIFMLLHRYMDRHVTDQLNEMLKVFNDADYPARLRLITEIDIIANTEPKILSIGKDE